MNRTLQYPFNRHRVSGFVLLVIMALLLPAQQSLTSTPPSVPRFSHPTRITNPYHPFVPGGLKVYMGEEDGEEIQIMDIYKTATRDFRLGSKTVRCRILQETEFADGELTEISQNYFAQADDGTVYYFGETVDNYEDGEVVSHGGSWLVGGRTLPSDPEDTVAAEVPAVFMPAHPRVGDTFKPEDLFPFVDETVTVIKTNVTVEVPAGRFNHCIKVRESTRLDDDTEVKFYAPGLGVIKAPEAELVMTSFVNSLAK